MARYKLSGGCACGDVHYSFDGEVVMAGHCHCRDCQRSSGTGSAAFFAIHRGKAQFTGKTASYTYKGDSGQGVTRHFCSHCGAPLFTHADVVPDLVFIRIASLDNPSQIRPSMHIYCDSSQVWDRPNDPLPKFGKMPS